LNSEESVVIYTPLLLLFFAPLFVALWGASLFKSGNTGAGFAKTNTKE
jgi:hypothetical protein